jgi:hypothetical protein
MRTLVLCLVIIATRFAVAAPPAYKMEKLYDMNAGTGGVYRYLSDFNANGKIVFEDTRPVVLGERHYEFDNGHITNLSEALLGPSSRGHAAYSNETGKYAMATSDDSGGFLRNGLNGENYAPTPYPGYEYVNVQGITERYAYGSSYFFLPSHGYNELAYIYDHVTRTRYDFVVNGSDADARRTTAMNEAGQAVVEFFPGPNQFSYSDVEQCELWQNGQRKIIGQMGGCHINSLGQVIGYVGNPRLPSYDTVQFWNGSALQSFSVGWAQPTSLSDNGLAYCTQGNGAFQAGRIFDSNTGTLYDLHAITSNMPAGMIAYHGLIRADGTIAAIGTENGKSYLLKFTPVPEPGSIFAVGFGLILLRRRRR